MVKLSDVKVNDYLRCPVGTEIGKGPWLTVRVVKIEEGIVEAILTSSEDHIQERNEVGTLYRIPNDTIERWYIPVNKILIEVEW